MDVRATLPTAKGEVGMSVEYEWSYQCIDKYDDIIDHDFVDRLGERPYWWLSGDCDTQDCVRHDLELWRNDGNEIDGLLDRQYALVAGDALPVYMDGGSKTPKRFHEELARHKRRQNARAGD